ncbi:restriction endonuclease subunit S [Enterococcus cecorum]|uniref:restriction endonuclease subunit S n=2 Tax=Enterococcus cecorum TaxID=44008 RepID=UPI001FAD092E|nr:restriction endonuclease subunit S [Enterococcus cecorum]MCJ0567957.1 restriction endonuclease subunit S [Enterococcus cecorum]
MNEKKKLQPKVRFREFTGENAPDWEQRKLGEVADIIGGGTPDTSNPNYWNGNIDWYSPVEIGNNIYISDSIKKITELGLQKSSAKLLPIGTVLFTSRAGIGNTAILSKEGCTNQGFQSIIPHQGILNSYFIFSKTAELKKYGERVGAGSTFVEVSGKQMRKMSICIPSYVEQQRIGHFFETLDKLITLHQRKLEQLEQLKNTLLSKMFPKSGTNIPEIRFSGFTDAWKQQRLGNISIMYQPETITSSELHNSGYPVFGANGYIGYFSKYNHKTDQVIISARGEKTGTANFVQGPIWITGNSMVINLDNSGVNKYFLYSNIKSFSLKKYITGGAQPQLTRDVLMKVPIVIPKINEQNNISKIFIKLDNYITIHQRKLDQLKNLKQTLLNKMFI